MRPEQPPFYFLHNLINLLVIDPDEKIVESISRCATEFPLYAVASAASNRKALSVIESEPRFHVCITELGLSDIENDECYLIRNYNRHFSCVAHTASQSAQSGFLAHAAGAQILIEKKTPLLLPEFFHEVNHWAMLGLINPRWRPGKQDPLSMSTMVLFEKSPEMVTQWAVDMGITDRELRYIWTKGLGANTKIILFMYTLFKNAFTFFEKCHQTGDISSLTKECLKSDSYRRMEEYFHMHRSTICDYLMFGNVANFVQ